jgi:hypothetical protein
MVPAVALVFHVPSMVGMVSGVMMGGMVMMRRLMTRRVRERGTRGEDHQGGKQMDFGHGTRVLV